LAGLPADQRVRQLAHLARTADYFALLDLSPDASTEAVERSAAFLGEVIRSAMQTQAPGVRALAEEVLRVVEEARHVLSAPDLRAAYQKHLTRRG
jgi:curved DNA-binding protein CbpA